MKNEDLLKQLKEAIKNHKNLLVYYHEDDDDPEEIYFDEEIQKYRGWLGIWNTKLLLDVANGKVFDLRLEVKGE